MNAFFDYDKWTEERQVGNPISTPPPRIAWKHIFSSRISKGLRCTICIWVGDTGTESYGCCAWCVCGVWQRGVKKAKPDKSKKKKKGVPEWIRKLAND
eukprot:COSAG05_NODE_438_length_9828_cov_4.712201_9_plen_98_part_00